MWTLNNVKQNELCFLKNTVDVIYFYYKNYKTHI